MIKTAFYALFVCLFCQAAIAAPSGWIDIYSANPNKTGEVKIEMKQGSFNRKVGKFGTVELFMLTRTIMDKNVVIFAKMSVLKDDCSAGYGQVYTDFLKGESPSVDTFIINGGNGYSRVAFALCKMDEVLP